MALNWGGGASGAVTGAAAGAPLGPWGSAAGSVVGGLTGLFGGQGGKPESRFTKGQKKAEKAYWEHPINENPLYQSATSYLQDLFSQSPEAYERFAAPMMREFNEQITPQLAARFAGAGTGSGALNSSSFQQALAHEAGSLQDRLAAMRSGLQMQGLQYGLPYAQQPYSNTIAGLGIDPYSNYFQEGPGFAESAISSLPSLFQGAKSWMGQQPQGGQQYQTQYPLTNYYDQNIRTQGWGF